MRLHVYVKGKPVAQLYRHQDNYALRYSMDASPEDFVSLTMPVREEPWVWPRDLHPFFRQNLPEGFLLEVIREEFGPFLDGTDLSLLAVIGGAGIGRVTVAPEGGQPSGELDPLDLNTLLHQDVSTQHFAELVRYYARAAISGAVPKFLAPEVSSAQTPVGKQTLRTRRHIIKGSDEQTPYLGFNEHYTMRVLARLDVARVAKTTMSDDGRLLVVDRFDVDENGMPAYGVEDACSLLGLSRRTGPDPPATGYRKKKQKGGTVYAAVDYAAGQGKPVFLSQVRARQY
ncbi:serine/threonine-protein kinase HipA [Paraburkholderia sacchari]